MGWACGAYGWGEGGVYRVSTQKPLPDNTQYLQDTDIYAPGGIRTRNPNKRAASKSFI